MEYIILWVLALFGVWNLISNIVEGFYVQNNIGRFDIFLNVCNDEDAIESLIGDLSKIGLINKIRINNSNSTDNTMEIVKRLSAINPRVIAEE